MIREIYENAEKKDCYKMMLLTGSKKESTIKFYEHAGYNSSDKTAFLRKVIEGEKTYVRGKS